MPPAYVGSHKISGGGPYVDAFAAAAAAVALVLCAACARRQTWSRSGRGLALIVCVCLLWTGSSVAIQLILHGDPMSAPFRKPFFLTYASSALTMVYLPFYAERLRADVAARRWTARRRRARRERRRRGARHSRGRESRRRRRHRRRSTWRRGSAHCGLPQPDVQPRARADVGDGDHAALVDVRADDARALGGAAGRAAHRRRHFRLHLVCRRRDGGAPARGQPRAHGESHDAPGAALALGSAALYAAYAVQLKRWVPDESSLPMPYLFGLMGLSNSALMWPLFIPPPPASGGSRGRRRSLRWRWRSCAPQHRALEHAAGAMLASPVVAVGLSLSIPFAMASTRCAAAAASLRSSSPAPPACGPAWRHRRRPPLRGCARARGAAAIRRHRRRQWVKIAIIP